MPSSRRPQPAAPRRMLTDWTTTAGLDGTGLLALVLGAATAEGIHLATLGYEVFVLHADQASAEAAEQAAHVHHVSGDPSALPAEWDRRFGLVVSIGGGVPVDQVGPAGLLVVVSADAVETPAGMTEVLREDIEDPDGPGLRLVRTVLARLA